MNRSQIATALAAVIAASVSAQAYELGSALQIERVRPDAVAAAPGGRVRDDLPIPLILDWGREEIPLVAGIRALDARIATAYVRPGELDDWLRQFEGANVRIDRARIFAPLLDIAATQTGYDKVGSLSASPVATGRDVIVAIIDTGIDIRNPDLVHADGSTRFLRYWDQDPSITDSSLHPPLGFEEDGGYECDANLINAGKCELDDDAPLSGLPPLGHGTHVAGIIASRHEKYRGLAPDAMLLGARVQFDSAHILAGIKWAVAWARLYRKPLVVNLSLGSNEGPHDGSDPMEMYIEGQSMPGSIFVAAAGNDGRHDSGAQLIHLGFDATSTPRYGLMSQGSVLGFGATRRITVETWFNASGKDNIQIDVLRASAGTSAVSVANRTDWIGLATLTTTPFVRTWGDLTVTVAGSADAVRGNFRVQIESSDTTTIAEDILIGLRTQGGATVTVDSWVSSRSAVWDGNSRTLVDGTTAYALVAGDDAKTIALPGTGKEVLTAGAYVSRNSWIDVDGSTGGSGLPLLTLSPISSLGPSRDGRLKPEVAAPGSRIASTLSRNHPAFSSQKVDETHWLLEGTSMAAPYLSGVVALMLEKNPSLSRAEALGLISQFAEADARVGDAPNDESGYGRLRIDEMFTDASWFAPSELEDHTPPRIGQVSAARRGDGWTISWNTDELATSSVTRIAGGKEVEAQQVQSFVVQHSVVLVDDAFDRIVVRSVDPRGNAAQRALTPDDLDQPSEGCSCRAAPQGPPDGQWESMLAGMLPLLVFGRRWIRARNR